MFYLTDNFFIIIFFFTFQTLKLHAITRFLPGSFQCGPQWGPFAVQFRDHLRSRNHLGAVQKWLSLKQGTRNEEWEWRTGNGESSKAGIFRTEIL